MNDKKHFLLLALAAVVCLAFFPACSGTVDAGSGSSDPSDSFADSLWAYDDDPMRIELYLYPDGKFYIDISNPTGQIDTNTINGTYEASGSTVTLTVVDGTEMKFSLKDNSYTLAGTLKGQEITFTRIT